MADKWKQLTPESLNDFDFPKELKNIILKFGFAFRNVSENGDRWTDVLSKEEVLKSFGNAELKRTDIDGEEYICWLVLFIADKDFKDED